MPKTVKVRVLVGVDNEGDWCALGWKGGGADDFETGVYDHLNDHTASFWLTADLPVPDKEPPEVAAVVEPAQ